MTTCSPSSYKMNPYDSALAMAKAIREGKVTSRELVEMSVERMERLDLNDNDTNALNAVVQRDVQAALQAADEADRTWRQWRDDVDGVRTEFGDQYLGALHGVPMTMKESHPTPGYYMCNGDPKMKYLTPKWTSCVGVTRLLEDGGVVILGKTNQPINACDWECNNPLYGRTGNPYDLTRSPGGSSGGGAAALAAGLTPLEFGSDIGGSIRIPAVMCGVVGHCGTRGIGTSLDAQMHCCGGCVDNILAKIIKYLAWMGRAGPMARNIPDLVAMMEILGGEAAENLPRPNPTSSLKDYRIAVWKTHELFPLGSEMTKAMDQAVAALQAAGVTVHQVTPPVDPMETYTLYLRYLSPFMSMHITKLQKQNAKHNKARDTYPDDMASPFWEMDMACVKGIPNDTDHRYQQALQTWNDYFDQHHYDAILCPIFPCEAWPTASEPNAMLAQATVLTRPIMIDDKECYYGDGLYFQHVQTLFGFPSTAFPVGFTSGTKKQLPVGLQAFGALGKDFIVLHVVQLLMEALGKDTFTPPADFAAVPP